MQKQELVMTGSGLVNIAALPDQDDGEMIDTRFGKIRIYRSNPIVFPNGMLGMPDKFEYCLTSFPSEKLSRFKLLQSLDENDLSFITLPADIENNIVERKDIELGCRDLELDINKLTLLFVVTVHRAGSQVRLSVNARAPIFIDTPRRVATQYVFHNSKYEIQHMITL